jgi:ACR3 family arsenite transporter
MEIVMEAGQVSSNVKRLNLFERYLTVWVGFCMLAGVMVGKLSPGVVSSLRSWELGEGSQVNIPIAVLIWLMIIPMMMKVDFASVRNVGKRPNGLIVTLLVNWLIKPFSMAFIAWLFFRHLFSAWIGLAEADQYIAGAIILAAAPCTAMVFVWSYLTDGDPAYTLVQVSVNDLIMLVLFAPLVGLLVSGASSLTVPFQVLLHSVITFIVIPLAVGTALRAWFIRRRGRAWFEETLLPRFAPVTIAALLATLVLIFAFQADNLTGKFLHVVLIAIPILLQVYFNSSLAYGLMKWMKVPHSVAAPGALIGASNFFELAVATAIALYGPGSGAALATVVGVLVEVPVMLSVCAFCNRTKDWFPVVVAERGPLSSSHRNPLSVERVW